MESFEITTEFSYRNGGPIGIQKAGAMDCAMVAAAPVLPAGFVVSVSRIARVRSGGETSPTKGGQVMLPNSSKMCLLP